jgi:hypothetical protein
VWLLGIALIAAHVDIVRQLKKAAPCYAVEANGILMISSSFPFRNIIGQGYGRMPHLTSKTGLFLRGQHLASL